MKKILLIAYYFEPFNNGGVQRIKCFKKYLKEYGYVVDILTTDVMGKIDGEENVIRIKDIGDEIRHNKNIFIAYPMKLFIKVAMYFGWIYDWFHFWKLCVMREIERKTDLEQYDYVIASYPPITNLTVGLFLSEKYSIPLIVDYRDGLLYDVFPYICEQSNRYQKLIGELENSVAEKSIFQIVVNEQMQKYYQDKYPFKRTIVIPNGFDTEEIFDGEAIEMPKGFNIVYTGLLGKYRFDYANEIIRKALNDNKDINLIYLGKLEDHEKCFFESYDNFYYYQEVPRNISILTQRKADMLLLVTGDSLGGTSGKLFEYLFSYRPILHIGNTENNASKIILETESGESFNNKMYKEIQIFIDSVKDGNSEKYTHHGIEKYGRRGECKMLAQYIDDFG